LALARFPTSLHTDTLIQLLGSPGIGKLFCIADQFQPGVIL